MRGRRRFPPGLVAAGLVLLAALGAAPQGEEPRQPLEEIVHHFAQKEEDYSRAHALYAYRLSVKIQELGDDGGLLGEFEQVMEVGFDRSGRRHATLPQNPRIDLSRLRVTGVELEDLNRIPLFVLSVEDIPDYDITYLTQERVDEVNTYLFRLDPKHPPRPGQRFFEGIVWVDAHKLDIVRALGRSLPAQTGGALNDFFQRLEVYRQPVDDYLFPTFVRADDVLTVHDRPTRLRLVVRFSNHKRVREPAPAPALAPQ